jgi:hypothetical protein
MSRRVSMVLFVGVVASIFMAFLGYFYAKNLNEAIIIGLLGIIITLLIEQIRTSVENREQVLNILALTQQVSDDEYLRARIESIVESFSTICNGKDQDLFLKEGRRSLTSCRDSLKNLAEGTFLIDEERRMRILIDILEKARPEEKILATSYVDLGDWWKRDLGRRYLQANYEAVQRGVIIERIFIVRPGEQEVEAFIEEQRKHNIIVRVVKESSVKPHLKENFFLVEDSILSYSEYSRDGQLVRGYISQDSRKHSEYREKFDLLRDHSEHQGAQVLPETKQFDSPENSKGNRGRVIGDRPRFPPTE